jgi:hypothetical protein
VENMSFAEGEDVELSKQSGTPTYTEADILMAGKPAVREQVEANENVLRDQTNIPVDPIIAPTGALASVKRSNLRPPQITRRSARARKA